MILDGVITVFFALLDGILTIIPPVPTFPVFQNMSIVSGFLGTANYYLPFQEATVMLEILFTVKAGMALYNFLMRIKPWGG